MKKNIRVYFYNFIGGDYYLKIGINGNKSVLRALLKKNVPELKTTREIKIVSVSDAMRESIEFVYCNEYYKKISGFNIDNWSIKK